MREKVNLLDVYVYPYFVTGNNNNQNICISILCNYFSLLLIYVITSDYFSVPQ